MSLIRSAKDRLNPYVQVNKKVFDDPKLSLKAKGFIAYCLTKPDHWQFHIDQLKKVLKEKEKSIRSVIQECIDNGYALRWQDRNTAGEFSPWETIISDSKKEIARIRKSLEEKGVFQIISPLAGFRNADNRNAEKDTLVKNDTSKNDSSKNHHPLTPSSGDPPSVASLPQSGTSLRSVDDDDFLPPKEKAARHYAVLAETSLSASHKAKLSRLHTESHVVAAVKAMRGARNVQDEMRYLCSILLGYKVNPPDEEEMEYESKEVRAALTFNEELAKVRPEIAKINEESIKTGIVHMFFRGMPTTLKMDTMTFFQDLKLATEEVKLMRQLE